MSEQIFNFLQKLPTGLRASAENQISKHLADQIWTIAARQATRWECTEVLKQQNPKIKNAKGRVQSEDRKGTKTWKAWRLQTTLLIDLNR